MIEVILDTEILKLLKKKLINWTPPCSNPGLEYRLNAQAEQYNLPPDVEYMKYEFVYIYFNQCLQLLIHSKSRIVSIPV